MSSIGFQKKPTRIYRKTLIKSSEKLNILFEGCYNEKKKVRLRVISRLL